MPLTEKNVTTLTELHSVSGQGIKAMVIYDTSSGEPYGLDVDVLITMDASITALGSGKADLVGGIVPLSQLPQMEDVAAAVVAAQLAETNAEAAEAQTLLYRDAAAAIVSGGPKGVYATLAALISANPDHAYTYVSIDDGNWNYWNGSTFVAGGAYQTALGVSQTVGTSTVNVPSENAVDNAIAAYNITLAVPLSEGQYYNSATAKSAVNIASGAKKGKSITYLTAYSEKDRLEILSIPTTAGSEIITLGGVAFSVELDPVTETTLALVAEKIATALFDGWGVGYTSGNTYVDFTKTTIGFCPTPAVTGATGMTSNFYILTAGENKNWVTEQFVGADTSTWDAGLKAEWIFITKTQKISLVFGSTNSVGVVGYLPHRKTTGVFANFGKIKISCNKGYSISHFHGNTPTNLTDGGYIIFDGGFYVIDINDAYLAFSVKKIDNSNFENDEDAQFAIVKYDSALKGYGDLIKENEDSIEEIKMELGVFNPPLVQGYIQYPIFALLPSDIRVTTKLFEPNGALTIVVNKGYKMSIVTGNSKKLLTTAGDVIIDGGEYVVPYNYKYVGLVFTKSNESSITVSESIAKIYRSDGSTLLDNAGNQTVTIIGASAKKFECRMVLLRLGQSYSFTFESDRFAANDGATDYIEIVGYPIGGIGARSSIVAAKYVAGGVSVPANITKYTPIRDEYLYIINNLTIDSYLNMTIKVLSQTIYESYKLNLDNINKLSLLKKYMIENMFMSGQTASPTLNKFLLIGGFDFNPVNGDVYVGTAANDSSYGETGATTEYSELIKFNMASPSSTVEVWPVFKHGDSFPTINYINLANISCAKITGADEVTILANVNGSTLATRKFTMSTKVFSGDCNIGTITIGAETFDMTVPNNEAIRTASGIEFFDTINNAILLNNNPIKIGSDYYACICFGKRSHALCKSADLTSWIFVCDMPFNQQAEEVELCYYSNRLFATSRGNAVYDGEYSKIMYCDIDTFTWSNPIVLTDCGQERPAMVAKDGKLYILHGLQNTAMDLVDGNYLPRNSKKMFIYDTNLNLLDSYTLGFQRDVVYPMLGMFAGNIYGFITCDLRGFAVNNGGNGRSELVFSYLDSRILDL